MANWRFNLDLKSIWKDGTSPEQKGKHISVCIQKQVPESWLDWDNDSYDAELDDIVNAFDNITGYDDVSPTEEFDNWMEALYNWSDQEVSLFGQWPPNKMMWVTTI